MQHLNHIPDPHLYMQSVSHEKGRSRKNTQTWPVVQVAASIIWSRDDGKSILVGSLASQELVKGGSGGWSGALGIRGDHGLVRRPRLRKGQTLDRDAEERGGMEYG